MKLKLFSHKKEPKYISSAIIPSVAFIANPTLTTSHHSLDDTSSKLLSGTLSSSLVGLSAEYKKNQINNSSDHDKNQIHNRSQSMDGGTMDYGYDVAGPSEIYRPSRPDRKYRQSEYSNDSKRHIDIANGLYETKESPIKIRPSRMSEHAVAQNTQKAPRPSSEYSLNQYEEYTSAKDVHFSKRNPEIDKPEIVISAPEVSYNNDRNVSRNIDFSPEREERRVALGQEVNPVVPESAYSVVDFNDDSVKASQLSNHTVTVSSQPGESLVTVPTQFKNDDCIPEYKMRNSDICESRQAPPRKNQGDDKHTRSLKDEIRRLKDEIYRLNAELSELLSDQGSGRPIGNSVLPGKGPAPSWIMNTKYLTPLIAVYDRKFHRQAAHIQKMQEQIARFEKEVKLVMKENERLHLKLQENQKGGPTNNNDWRIIVEQTKLVIQENQMLLEELDLQQQRTKELDKKYVDEVAQLRLSLASITSERDANNEQLTKITERIGSVSAKTNALSENQIDDLVRDKKVLESEIEKLRMNEGRMEKKIEKYKSMIKTEKDFRKYLNDVIDKSNEIANERDRLLEMMSLRDSEIRRMSTKVINEIKYNLNLSIDASSSAVTVRKSDDAAMEQIYTLDAWISMLVQSVDDLTSRCRHQEKDVHYYQNLLLEKDKLIQECEKENEELESKLDSLWRNAIKD